MHRIAIGLLFTLFAFNSYGIVLSPTTLEYNISKNQSGKIVLTNNSTERIAIEANVFKLKFNDKGQLYERQPDDSSLLIFPMAVILKPDESQLFRLQWLDSKYLDQSESYFVRFSQINLKTPNEDNQGVVPSVNFQIHYNTLVHVYSDNNKPNVILRVNNRGLAKLENNGNRFIYSSQLSFQFPSGAMNRLEDGFGEYFIPPYSYVELSEPVDIPVGNYYGQENN